MKILTLSLLLIPIFANSQNLVSNPSFEDMISCDQLSTEGDNAEGWIQVEPTADYYNYTCQVHNDIDTVGHTGNGYTGVSCLRPSWNSTYREYMGRYLDSALTAGVEYYVEFWVKLPASKCVGTDAFGALFTEGLPIPVDPWTDLLPYTPQIENPQYRMINDLYHWQKICGTFVADGGEDFITIGSFKDDHGSTFAPPLQDTLPCEGGGYGVHWSYILIDDVLVTPNLNLATSCADSSYSLPATTINPFAEEGEEIVENNEEIEWQECQFNLPNIITPNNDNTNDYFPLNFQGDWTFSIMDRWGRLIYYTDQDGADKWNGKDDFGDILNDGVYFYLFEDVSNSCRQHGTVTVVR